MTYEAPDPFVTAGELGRRARRVWFFFFAFVVAATFVVIYTARDYGRSAATAELADQARTEANLKIALLRAVLERPRALPLVLSQDREIAEALATRSAEAIERLNRKLEGLVKDTQAAVIYVIGTSGTAISSSNWREPTSFIGSDYGFRAYFRDAMHDGSGEDFALGSVSKRPGLYISRRVGTGENPLGVVVVKMEFDQLEADWRATGRPTFIVDEHGVVLITSIPSWRFMTMEAMAADRLAAIRASLQFGEASLQPLPFRQERLDSGLVTITAIMPGSGESQFLKLPVAVPGSLWTLEYLLPLQPALDNATRQATATALAILTAAILLGAVVLWRRQAAVARLALASQAREELERRVLERTRDLSQARDLLQNEISEHKSTEQKLQGVQQELVAANRLAILGQVAAGVAHEINQPVATIRAYADNARTFLERDKPEQAAENLSLIGELTERIGTITDELKSFARKGRAAPEPVVLRDVLQGAVFLLRSRFAGRLDALDITLPPEGLKVLGGRMRLEQVFINLFQNALEAVEAMPEPWVRVRAETGAEEILVTVEDNGPGIPAAIQDALFTPFNTSKERGLGLGLVISKEILADYKASIGATSSSSGTCFTVRLRKA